MTAGLQVPKLDPRGVARRVANDVTRTVKSKLSEDLIALYPRIAVARAA